jgi:uncharacterized protein YegL
MSERKLPVYLLLDTSGSMHGEPIEAVKNGVQMLISSLRSDPFALENAHVSVITFDSTAKQVAPLTELPAFQIPVIAASGETNLGEGLSLLASCILSEVKRGTTDSRGDWRPLVFIMTDGEPTDSWKQGLDKLKQVRTGIIVACAAGPGADTSVLKQITEVVVQIDTADQSSIKAFFKWVSSSISVGSQKVESGHKDVTGLAELPPPPPEIKLVP